MCHIRSCAGTADAGKLVSNLGDSVLKKKREKESEYETKRERERDRVEKVLAGRRKPCVITYWLKPSGATFYQGEREREREREGERERGWHAREMALERETRGRVC
jgi:hypothetical protein